MVGLDSEITSYCRINIRRIHNVEPLGKFLFWVSSCYLDQSASLKSFSSYLFNSQKLFSSQGASGKFDRTLLQVCFDSIHYIRTTQKTVLRLKGKLVWCTIHLLLFFGCWFLCVSDTWGNEAKSSVGVAVTRFPHICTDLLSERLTLLGLSKVRLQSQ